VIAAVQKGDEQGDQTGREEKKNPHRSIASTGKQRV